jgi:aspartyl protease family protein
MVLPQGAMRGSLLGMSFLSRLRSFAVEDGVLYLRD